MDDKALVPVESAGDSLVRLAIEKGIDVDNLQRLINMRNAEIERQAKLDFQTNFAIMQSRFGSVSREKQGYGYKYAPIELLQKTFGPIIAEHGFSYSWRESLVENMPDWKRCILTISGYGYSQENHFDIPPVERTKQMNAVQAVGAMSTYGRRYSFISGFGIIIDDEDPDGRVLVSDIETLSDPKGSDGKYSPPIEPTAPAPKGDGTRGDMQALKVKLFDIAAMKDEDTDVFSPDQKKDINADYHPGGRNLEPSLTDLEYLRGIVEKWDTMGKAIIERQQALDKEADDGFRLALDKVD